MTRPTVLSPVGRKLATPVSLVTDSAAMSTRTDTNGVHFCP